MSFVVEQADVQFASECAVLEDASQDGAFGFTLSIGIATCPGDADTREELVRQADRALYAAKGGGRNRSVAARDLGEEPVAPAPAAPLQGQGR